jgi:hypothetical protein
LDSQLSSDLFHIKKVNENLIKASLLDLDFYESIDDRLLLKEVFSSFFKRGDRLFFTFRREENLTEEEELFELRKKIPNRFADYVLIRKIDDERFDSIGCLNYSHETPSFLLDVWRYFYAFVVFRPNDDITWDQFILYTKKEGIDDIDCRKLLSKKISNFALVKGLGGDYLNIVMNSKTALPFL